jgi:hypothetical protein
VLVCLVIDTGSQQVELDTALADLGHIFSASLTPGEKGQQQESQQWLAASSTGKGGIQAALEQMQERYGRLP